MKVLLNAILDEEDNNGSHTEHYKLYKWADLFIEPQQDTTIILPDGSTFHINVVIQDLKSGYVVLVYKHTLYYTDVRCGEMDPLYVHYIERGWQHEIPM